MNAAAVTVLIIEVWAGVLAVVGLTWIVACLVAPLIPTRSTVTAKPLAKPLAEVYELRPQSSVPTGPKDGAA